jgi:hypothetical protein
VDTRNASIVGFYSWPEKTNDHSTPWPNRGGMVKGLAKIEPLAPWL